MRFNVSSKLMLLTGVGILCSTGLTIAALVGFSRVQNRLAEVAVSAQAMRNHLEGDMMHDALRGDVLFAFVASNDEERALAAEEFNAHADWFKKCIQANAELDLPAPVRSSIAEVAPAIDEYIAAAEIMYTRALKDPAEARAGLAEFQAEFSALEEKTESLSDRISAHAEETEAHAKQYIRAASTWMIASVCAGAGCSAFIGWFISRGIVRPLARCVGVMEAIASGNLTARVSITQHDEIGRLAAAADIAAESMSRMVREIASASSQVASASTEIAATSRSMSSSIESQSREIAEITSAVTEVSNATSDVARRSEEASRSAADSGRLARSGGDVVTKTIEGIAGITESVRAGTASVTELGKRGEQIGKIIGVINDIADQTNLLALNAAIEAARAGDHGRGFAVVADEVRKLADRTTKATDEIGESIRAIQTETTQAVERMNAGNERVKQGSTLAAEAGKSLESIVEASTSVGSMIEHIAAAATEQLESTRHMAERIESIRRVSEDAHVGAVNTSEAANVLSLKAEELNRLVSRFTVETGHAHQPSA